MRPPGSRADDGCLAHATGCGCLGLGALLVVVGLTYGLLVAYTLAAAWLAGVDVAWRPLF